MLVEVKKLSFAWEEKCIFNELSLALPEGKITAILGVSGTGKSTLLHLITGALTPQAGNIFYQGYSLNGLSKRDLYQFRKKIGFLFQNNALLSELSVFENVALPLRVHTNLPEKLIASVCAMKLNAVGLPNVCQLMPSQLSGGMARRAALARALALDPSFLMFDEPFTGQDPLTLKILTRLIKVLNQSFKTTVLLVSHDLELTLQLCDYAYLLHNGQVMAQGTPEALRRHTDEAVRSFLNAHLKGVLSDTNLSTGAIESYRKTFFGEVVQTHLDRNPTHS